MTREGSSPFDNAILDHDMSESLKISQVLRDSTGIGQEGGKYKLQLWWEATIEKNHVARQ